MLTAPFSLPCSEADESAARLLGKKLSTGFADVFRESLSATSITVEDSKVEAASETPDQGAGLRTFDGKRTLFAHAAYPGEAATLLLASELARMKRPALTGNTPCAHPWPAAYGLKTLKEKAALCLKLDSLARSVDQKITQVKLSYRDHRRLVRTTLSTGEAFEDYQEGLYFSVLVTASLNGVVQTGYESLGGSGGWELFEDGDAEEKVVLAAKRAVTMLSARKAPAGTFPVVLSSEAGGTMVHEAVGHGLEADLVLQGHSIYEGLLGKRVASKLITVLDDPTLPGKRGSYAFDDEGVASSPTVLIEKGILKTYLSSRETALELDLAPTGNGRRESYRHLPIPRMSNTLIAPGSHDPATIIRETGQGLYVTRMGGGQVDTVSGDFVFEVAEGFMIEGGQVGEPVRGATLAGNGPRVLKAIDRVGTDLGFGLGTCGKDGQGAPVADAQPTLRIPELTVGGG